MVTDEHEREMVEEMHRVADTLIRIARLETEHSAAAISALIYASGYWAVRCRVSEDAYRDLLNIVVDHFYPRQQKGHHERNC